MDDKCMRVYLPIPFQIPQKSSSVVCFSWVVIQYTEPISHDI